MTRRYMLCCVSTWYQSIVECRRVASVARGTCHFPSLAVRRFRRFYVLIPASHPRPTRALHNTPRATTCRYPQDNGVGAPINRGDGTLRRAQKQFELSVITFPKHCPTGWWSVATEVAAAVICNHAVKAALCAWVESTEGNRMRKVCYPADKSSSGR